MAEFVHNHRPHSVTGKSPFYLMLGYEPQALPDIISTSNLPSVTTRLDNLVKIREEALATHDLARQTMSQRTRSSFTPFSVNDKVWLEAKEPEMQDTRS